MILSIDNQGPRVSVVMPVYNGENTIKKAIDSVLDQTFKDFELIICNDASTDGTEEILKKLNDSRIINFSNKIKMGAGISRNKIIRIARGKYLAFIDADDKWAPERLQVLLDVLEKETYGKALIFDDIIECHDTPRGLIPWRRVRGVNAYGGESYSAVVVPPHQYIISKRLIMSPIIPSDIIKKNKVKQNELPCAEDIYFFLQIIALGVKMLYFPKALYYYRITPGSATSNPERTKMARKVLESSIELFQESPKAQAALKEKIDMTIREEQYFPFLIEIKNRNFYKAFQMLLCSPWLIFEFFSRLRLSLFYQVHRIWNGGRTRKVS
jgi:succinoglycan biosynthesis protein ExoO